MTDHAPFVIFVNEHRFEVDQPKIEGLQVRVLAGIDPDTMLVTEGTGIDPDRVLNDTDVLSLENGPLHIFAKPPTAFGMYNHAAL
jgi:hypothetical protein